MMKISGLGEFGFIERLKRFQNLSSRIVKGIGDDAAVLPLNASHYQLFTTDMIVEGVHFLPHTPYRNIGHKALACNISDIAAMGGVPRSAVVSLGLPGNTGVDRALDIYRGMHALAREFGVSIVGGDTVRSDRLVISVALLGEVKKRHLITRDGAREGDAIFVSGPLGNSFKSGRHLSFMPRVKEACMLSLRFAPTAMMDISDGLAGDLGHILKASGVGAVLDASRIPRARGATLEQALFEGEDFELLFTLSRARARRLLAWKAGGDFYEIGRILAGKPKLFLEDAKGRHEVEKKGFTHF
jgi:thiamine-monophosphate kinase